MVDIFLMVFISAVVLVGVGGFIYANWTDNKK